MGRPRTQNPICSVKDCDNKTIAKGLCMSHYRRTLRKANGEVSDKPLDAPIAEHRGLVSVHSLRLTPEIATVYESLAKKRGLSTYDLTRRLVEDYVMKAMQDALSPRS